MGYKSVQMKEHMETQKQTNNSIIRELRDIWAQAKKPSEEYFTPFLPRNLNFDGRDELLRDFVSKFSKETLAIPNLDVSTIVQAFKMGLKKDTPFYDDLVMNHYRNMDEARNKALRFIRLEEDRMIQQRLDGSNNYNQPNRESASSKPYRPKPYSKNDRVNVARWPRKNEKNGAWKDKSKWCAFHEDFGYMTEDCIALRKENNYLLSKGHLKELLGKKNQNGDPEKDPKRAKSPSGAMIVNIISGGSDICGTSYIAARRSAKVAKAEKPEGPTKMMNMPRECEVTFDYEDINNIQDSHHDGLVITLYMSNCFVRRILVDNGSSVNII
ncbi:uncharacterized protein LOC143609919 [Bidens hawaiensis]|uniref:uncharacterized protein LOC143609919 n=1 Tax=Bidens hawaiensis TaxID=980011 RepID=UPI00404911BB